MRSVVAMLSSATHQPALAPAHKVQSMESVRIEKSMLSYGYRIGVEIGKGSYARVLQGVHTLSGRKVAVKIIDRRKATRGDFINKFLPRELQLIAKLRHPNIIRVEMILDDGVCVCEIQELAERGDLLTYLQKRKRVPEPEAKLMFRQMLTAVEYLHDQDVVHRDLKCENLLLDKNDNIKIADFGFVRILHEADWSHTWCGSKAYAAPEILNARCYNGKGVDVWSLGVILYIVLTGLMPYDERNRAHMMKKQMDHRISYHHKVINIVCQEAKTLIYDMLHPDPIKRPTANMIQDNIWLNDVPWRLRDKPTQL